MRVIIMTARMTCLPWQSSMIADEPKPRNKNTQSGKLEIS